MSVKKATTKKVLSEYRKQRKRVLARARALEKRGYIVDRNIIPEIPEKITAKDVKALTAINPERFYTSSEYYNRWTGEIVSGLEGRKLEQKRSAYKGVITRHKKEGIAVAPARTKAEEFLSEYGEENKFKWETEGTEEYYELRRYQDEYYERFNDRDESEETVYDSVDSDSVEQEYYVYLDDEGMPIFVVDENGEIRTDLTAVNGELVTDSVTGEQHLAKPVFWGEIPQEGEVVLENLKQEVDVSALRDVERTLDTPPTGMSASGTAYHELQNAKIGDLLERAISLKGEENVAVNIQNNADRISEIINRVRATYRDYEAEGYLAEFYEILTGDSVYGDEWFNAYLESGEYWDYDEM